MACCAFAVFVISQFCFALQRLRTFLFGLSLNQPVRDNPTVDWQLLQAVPSLVPGRHAPPAQFPVWWQRPRFALAVAIVVLGIEVPLLGTWLGYTELHRQHLAELVHWIDQFICRGADPAAVQ